MKYKLHLILAFLITASLTEAINLSVLKTTPEMIAQLEELKTLKKFKEDSSSFYPGAPDEATRLAAESAINTAISELIVASKGTFTEDKFWSILEVAARKLSLMDSEEMDRGLGYMEDIMDIFEIESSGGRLNRWRYGFEIE